VTHSLARRRAGEIRVGRGVVSLPRQNHLQAQGLLEYALILVLVAVVVLLILAIMGPAVGNMYSNVIAQF
jgi:pilus assembly protein Flp/PilA